VVPQFWIYFFIALDFYGPWYLHHSVVWNYYHDIITAYRGPRDPLPIPELSVDEFTREKLLELSKGLTFPCVIRGALRDTDAVKNWAKAEWWLEHYGDEEVLVKPISRTYSGGTTFATIKEWYKLAKEDGSRYYINGASSLFKRRPELLAMISSDITRNCSPVVGDEAVNIQLFMGRAGSGSPIHSGFGTNLFRQMVGRKRWWFFPPSEKAWLKPSLTNAGFTMHSTIQQAPIGGNVTDAIVPKLIRYTAVLEPGDLLINPSWFWHSIENVDNFTAGVASRYGDTGSWNAAGARTDLPITLMAVSKAIYRFGSFEKFKEEYGQAKPLAANGRDVLENQLEKNRLKESYKGTEPTSKKNDD